MQSNFNFLKEIEMPEVVSYDEANLETSPAITMRRFAVLFELMPSKIFYVPLYFAYNCRLYIAPQNLKYFPSLVFDIKGYNLRKNDIKEVNCKRLPETIDNTTVYENNEKQLEKLLVNKNMEQSKLRVTKLWSEN